MTSCNSKSTYKVYKRSYSWNISPEKKNETKKNTDSK